MKNRMLGVAVIVLLGTAQRSPAEPGNWPQWRGPDRTDLSAETGLLQSWPEGGPKRVWLNEDIGLGYSGPAIMDGQLYIMGARGEKEFLLALDAADGRELWAVEIGELLKNNWGDGPRGTPAVDGQYVYALGGHGNLVCALRADGTVRWTKSMKDLGGKLPNWGYTESPLVDGDHVICTPGGEQGAVAALNKLTGEPVWQSKEFKDGAQYASIMPIAHDGQRQYVQLTMKHVVGLNPQTGEVLWTSDWPGRTAVIPTPIYAQGQVYVTSGYGVGCKLIRLNGTPQPEEVYANKNMKNHHGGVILLKGNLYGYSDNVGWLCQDFETGEEVWSEKKPLGKGAIAYADGQFYCLDESSGDVVLIDASPEGWNERGRFTIEPQTELRKPSGRIWTHPVIVDGRLYLRDQELLFCYDVKAP